MKALLVVFCILSVYSSQSQLLHDQNVFNHDDTLRGTITRERSWWDVTWYGITVQPEFTAKTIRGKITMEFRVVEAGDLMQIDLQQPMELLSATWNNQPLTFQRNHNIYLLTFATKMAKGSLQRIEMGFEGKPREAINPPWDGGWIWKKDRNGSPWMSVACQGLGASAWYPCKDHQSDEPDSASLTMIVPDSLVAVGNGRMRAMTKNGNGTATYTWAVKNPINNYNIIPYIGKYVHWGETFDGEKGELDCNYWVLNYNLDSAKAQFRQVVPMLKCFEQWFGPYPFYEDGYKLVESPHLGMEHQSAVGYGNRFRNGYLGRDLSGTGWGLKWDFIIIHESGHEWFGNNITSKDLGDMWIHESFTNYSETIYTSCQFGKEAGNDYVIGTRKAIGNKAPIIGPYNVNSEGNGGTDMYYKGGNMIHTLRQVINNDTLFREVLRGLNRTFYHQTVTAGQVENYISKQSKIDFSKVFDQYLRNIQVPVLEYKYKGSQLVYRWANCVKGFNMPVKVILGGEKWLKPTDQWKTLEGAQAGLQVDRNFYVQTKQVE